MTTTENKPRVKKPTEQFVLMKQTWLRIKWALIKDGHYVIAASIDKYIKDKRATENVEIAVPLDLCGIIARTCASHDLSVGKRFATAASSYQHVSHKEKPVPKEAVEIAKEELEGMED